MTATAERIGPERVAERLAAVRQRVAEAAGRAGRPASAVKLVVVTKGVAPPVMQAALDAGATDLGENRAQELLAKAPELKSRPTWHFIGRLQRNKVASLAPLVDGLRSAGLSVDGLMTIPAAGRDPRPAFARLAALADRLGLAEVSMGMSDDFEVAVEEGTTIVRVGRAIFGLR